MNPIALPTSPETRAALEKAGWNYMRTYFGGAEQWQCVDRETWVHVHPDGHLTGAEDVQRMMQFAAILGIAPDGYRIIPDLTAPNPHFDWTFSGARLLSPRPSEEGGSSPSPLALLKSLYACAVNSAKVEPELERQIRQAIGEPVREPILRPDGQAMFASVDRYLASYDTGRVVGKLKKFLEGTTESGEEETP